MPRMAGHPRKPGLDTRVAAQVKPALMGHMGVGIQRHVRNRVLLTDQVRRAEYENCHRAGYKALDVMEQQLQRTPYLVGEQYSIADISLYAYTHVAHEGGFDLSGYPAINAWLARVASHPRHVAMLD